MKQQRNTKQRQLILDTVQTRCDHPTAEEIYQEVQAVDSKISRGTVYRNLGILVQNGEILHVKLPKADRFEPRQSLHYHLLCKSCGAVSDVSQAYQTALDQEVAAQTGYTIERHRTVFEGLCPACRQKPPED